MIWHAEITPEIINTRNQGTLAEFFGIVFTEIRPDCIIACMQLQPLHMQPHGIMHGGASCVLAETVGSVGANYCVEPQRYYCVGLDINTNHITAVHSGALVALGRPFHVGRLTQVWSIEVHDEKKKLVSVTRLTLVIRAK